MSDYFGPGVGRHLNGNGRQYTSVVFQPNKPPIAEEFNLLNDMTDRARREIIQANIPSGWVSDPFDPKSDYTFDPQASNMFWLGKNRTGGDADIPVALVNGWTIPVAGTLSTDLRSAIKLPPPAGSTSSADVNFVFLEVWQAPVSPDGTVNKPAEDLIYRFGNVEYGGTNLTNQILDPRFGIETSERIQLQYRIRVVESVNPEAFPYGFNSAIRAQGPLDDVVTSVDSAYQFENMEAELGDPGLWRAGVANELSSDGTLLLSQSDLETLDGYVYAVPIALVFRRSSEGWDVGQQAGATNRFPTMSVRTEAKVLPTVSLVADVAYDDLTIEVDVSQSATEFPATDGLIKINREIIYYDTWSGTTLTVNSAGRGYRDTHATNHLTDDVVNFVTGHPLNYFSDQIVEADVYDLRHTVNLGGLSYDAILQHNFFKLCEGSLQTQWKVSSGDVKGTRHFQADYFSQGAPPANYAIERDGPDGFRKVFSDACTPQPNNLLVIPPDTNSVTSSNYSFNLSSTVVYHDAGAGTWSRGDNVRIPLNPLRASFKTADDKKVRFVHPSEYSDTSHDPVRVWFGDRTSATFADDGMVADRGLVVLGETPDVSSTFHTGLSSDITYEGNLLTVDAVNFTSLAPDGVTLMGDYLASLDAYIVLEETGYNLPVKGAFKILGEAGGGSLSVENVDGSGVPNFGAGATATFDWRIRLPNCTEDDDDLIVVLGDPGTGDDFFDAALYLSFDVLYHPNQGLSRVPEIPIQTRLEPGAATPYVRENTFQNVATSTVQSVKLYPPIPMESYPVDRSRPRFRTDDARTSVEETWAESYVDKGSKTILFQPMQEAVVYLNGTTIDDGVDDVSSYAIPGTSTPLDFQLADGNPAYFIPKELLPPAGRIDVPFVRETTGTVPFGLNLAIPVLQGGTRVNENITRERIVAVFDPVNTNPDTQYNTLVDLSTVGAGGPSENALVCRLYDKGGVRGIELPPHFGISRLFGIYDETDFYANGGEFSGGSNYRTKKNTWAGTNLIRTDIKRRSLIITDENTFVIPEDAIDLNLTTVDLSICQLVFEFGGFMFNDWLADRVQIHVVEGETAPDGPVDMYLNGPVASVDTFFQVSTRIPYQGNVNGTMPVSSTDTASTSFEDYQPKGQADRASDLANIDDPLDRRDARWINRAKLEILAALPFVTSIGTGRVSGAFAPGSYTDVGYLSNSNFPLVADEERRARTRGLHEEMGPEGPTVQRPVPDALAGMTERLPAGLYASDHMFLGEGFYGEQRRFWTHASTHYENTFSEYRNNIQLTKPFMEDWVVISDGTSGGNSVGVTYTNTTDLFRTYRGGVLTAAGGTNPGGAVMLATDRLYKEFPFLRDFGTEYAKLTEDNRQGSITNDELADGIETLVASYQKKFQVHGGAMFGVAFLVRTLKETVTDNELVFNNGGELQMLVMTGSDFGVDMALNPLEGAPLSKELIQPVIQLSPAGTGEGWSAADRYHCDGRPLRGNSKESPEIEFDLHRGAKPAEDDDCICP